MERNNRQHGTWLPLIATLASGLCLAGLLEAGEVYRWVDENGQVHYSESLPPDFQDKGHDVLNESGLVTDEDQKLTPLPPPEAPPEEERQELPRDASGMPRAKARYSDAELLRRMDNFLMLRYDSEQEILDAMDVEIRQLEYDRRLLETTQASMQTAYRGQIRQAANAQRAGQPVAEAISTEISKLQRQLVQNQRSMDSLALREAGIREDFSKQIERFRYLVGQQADEDAEG
jgi:hypothetical protein